MPIIAAAVCPHPPLLVPELASRAAPELNTLRVACLTAIDELAAAAPDALLIVGSGPGRITRYAAGASGDFGPYGAPQVKVDLGDGSTQQALPIGEAGAQPGFLAGEAGSSRHGLPLSLLMGAWLVQQSKAGGLPRTGLTVPADATPESCLAAGQELAAGDARVALLVMGDGSARRSEHSPVHLHPRAEIFDATVAAAFDLADRSRLAALDPDLAAELQAAGRGPWQVLAGATSSGAWQGDLTYNAAPYGVGYFVTSWTRTG